MIVQLADDDHVVQIVNHPPYLNGFYFYNSDAYANFVGPFITDEQALAAYRKCCEDLKTQNTPDIFNPLDYGIHGVPLMVPADKYNSAIARVAELEQIDIKAKWESAQRHAAVVAERDAARAELAAERERASMWERRHDNAHKEWSIAYNERCRAIARVAELEKQCSLAMEAIMPCLQLTNDECDALHTLLSNIGGCPEKSKRKHMVTINDKLRKAMSKRRGEVFSYNTSFDDNFYITEGNRMYWKDTQ